MPPLYIPPYVYILVPVTLLSVISVNPLYLPHSVYNPMSTPSCVPPRSTSSIYRLPSTLMCLPPPVYHRGLPSSIYRLLSTPLWLPLSVYHLCKPILPTAFHLHPYVYPFQSTASVPPPSIDRFLSTPLSLPPFCLPPLSTLIYLPHSVYTAVSIPFSRPPLSTHPLRPGPTHPTHPNTKSAKRRVDGSFS